MNNRVLPLVRLPSQLSDQTAAELLELLYDIIRVVEHYYAPQLERYHQRNNPNPPEHHDEHDPPF